MTGSEDHVRSIVRAHGGEAKSAFPLDEDRVELLAYATLRERRGAMPDLLGPVIGIYEWQSAPLVVLIDGDRLGGKGHLSRIRRALALRGDIPYVGVAAGGKLDVYPVGLAKAMTKVVVPSEIEADATALLPYIASTRPGQTPQAATISKVVLTLLNTALKTLKACGLSETDAISLAGRALFARFLADRDLPLGDHMEGQNAGDAFSTPDLALRTCRWLDATFNGNLLPFDVESLGHLPEKGFGVLIDIMRRAPGGQMSLGWHNRWDDLHFAHIPVGILSQVYEQYLKATEPNRQKKEGSYYTPVPIADMMVRACLQGLPPSERHAARVLDPAAGAGVFLITAFRHLVAERWLRDGQRPDTGVLREILYRQVAGFDINEAALRFAALGLYLVSVELDPEPEPVSKLAFWDLRGLVLFRPESDETWKGPRGEVGLSELGSLGPGISSIHEGRYDVVVGNPPWKTGVRLTGWDWVEAKVRSIAGKRAKPHSPDDGDRSSEVSIEGMVEPSSVTSSPAGRANRRPPKVPSGPSLLPNNALDLPFVWRAGEWARPGGQIAFALHGRLLFQQSDGMPLARTTLLRGFDVTSVVNGAALRQSQVWPNVSAPFCLLFARNAGAEPAGAFRFVTPREEPRLNRVGAFRLDAARAPIVLASDIVEDPLMLKTLFRGSDLDLEIRRRISGDGHCTFAETIHGRGGFSGSGLQRLRPSSRTRDGQTEPGADVSYLKGKPYLQVGPPAPVIDVTALPRFDWDRAHDPRDARTFDGPLLIVDKVARAQVPGFSVGFAESDVVFSENYYGYGFDHTPAGREMAAHLAAILRSRISRWWLLMTSGEYGFEREVVEKEAFDSLPVPLPRALDDGDTLSAWYRRNAGNLDQEALDRRVARLYGLSRSELRIVDDTLRHAFVRTTADKERPDTLTGKRGKASLATVRPGFLDIVPFLEGLNEELDPWESKFEIDLKASPGDARLSPTWRFVRLGRNAAKPVTQRDAEVFQGMIQAADETGSTEVFHQAGDGRLWIGLPEQDRYWSYSQGLRCGRHVIWDHIDFLVGDGLDGD